MGWGWDLTIQDFCFAANSVDVSVFAKFLGLDTLSRGLSVSLHGVGLALPLKGCGVPLA